MSDYTEDKRDLRVKQLTEEYYKLCDNMHKNPDLNMILDMTGNYSKIKYGKSTHI